MVKKIKNVAVTGGAGQISYQILFRIANGDMLGKDQPIALHILEIPKAVEALEGVKMELMDCAFPLLADVKIGSDPKQMFNDAHYAILIGAKPRGPGMERKDLLSENAKIFVEQGKALNEVANRDVKVLVVGNPCNSNCLIAMSHAPNIPKKNFHAMTRLDQNRAKAQLAEKAFANVDEVSNVTIWGNHSTTQVPDFYNAKVKGENATGIISDHAWLENEFISLVQKRGAAVIAARGKSSAASAANAAIDAIKSLVTKTAEGDWFSTGVISDGNPYGIESGIVFSFPCRSNGDGNFEIVSDIPLNDFLKEKLEASETELLEEKECIKDHLPVKV